MCSPLVSSFQSNFAIFCFYLATNRPHNGLIILYSNIVLFQRVPFSGSLVQHVQSSTRSALKKNQVRIF